MFELDYLYEQLKQQTIEQDYINVLNTVTESCYDVVEADNAISETVEMIEEAVKKVKFNFFDNLKSAFTSVDKTLSKYKEKALKCNPIGLSYKNYITTISISEIEKKYRAALSHLNKFNPNTASEEELKKYIMDSMHNVQYNEVSKIFGDGKERFGIDEIVIKKKEEKEISKQDIKDAVKYLEGYKSTIEKLNRDSNKKNEEYTQFVRSNGLATGKTSSDINKLRKNALNHKTALIAIVDSTYFSMLSVKYTYESNQAKRIVIKTANYNPRNLKESYVVQDYIDAMYEYNEMQEIILKGMKYKMTKEKKEQLSNRLVLAPRKPMSFPHQGSILPCKTKKASRTPCHRHSNTADSNTNITKCAMQETCFARKGSAQKPFTER